MVVLVQKIWIMSDFPKRVKNIDFSHQTGHISGPDKARTFNESSLKSSDSALSRGSNGFSISWLHNCVSVRFVLMSAMRARRTNICEVTIAEFVKIEHQSMTPRI